MSNPKSNHFFIEKNYVDFFNNSKILNANRTNAVSKRENFLFVAALGVYMGFKTPFENSKTVGLDLFVMNQLTDEELALIYAIAIKDTKDLEIINNDIKVAQIAMEYANTGIIELKKIEENSRRGNEIKHLQVLIHDVIDNLQL